MNQNYTKNSLFSINISSSTIKELKKAFGVNNSGKKIFFAFLLLFIFALNARAQCTISTDTNSSSLTCSQFNNCGEIIYIGNGTNAMTLTINSDFNLSCLGSIQFIIRDKATVTFDDKGGPTLTFAEGSSIIVNSGGKLDGGKNCNSSDKIFIGNRTAATCDGNGNADSSFADIVNLGGTGSASSNSTVCTGNQLVLTATAPVAPSGGSYTFTYKWSGSGIYSPAFSTSPTYTINNVNVYNHGGVYTVEIKRNDNMSSTTTTNVVINASPKAGAVYDGNSQICLNSSTGNMRVGGDFLGSVIRWEKRLNSGVWNSISNTSTVYSENPSVAGTWYYRAVVGSGTCPEVYSTPFTVVVNPELTITLVSNNSSACKPATNSTLSYTATTGNSSAIKIDFDATANSAGVQDINYQSVSSGSGTIVIQFAGGTAVGVYSGVLTVIKDYPSCTSSITYPVTLTIGSAPLMATQPSTTAQNICLNGTVSGLSVVASNAVSYQWYSNGANNNTTGTSLNGATNNSYTPQNNTAGALYYYCVITGSCGTTVTSNVSGLITVNALPTIGGTLNVCAGSTTALTGSGTANATTPWTSGTPSVATVSNLGVVSGVASGTSIITYKNNNGCTITATVIVNALPIVAVNGPIEINCTNTTAALSGTGSATSNVTYDWSTDDGTFSGATNAITATATTAGTYTLTVTKTDTGCFDSETVIVTKNIPTNTWDGIKWSDGTPTSLQEIKFTGGYDIDADVNGCSCKVTGSKDVTIKSGKTMKIVNEVEVLGSGKLIFENNASLVQINDDAVNVGNIIYKRTTGEIYDTDYVYWSSPVIGAKLSAIQSGTLYYSFNATGNSWVRAYATSAMANAIGYIVRGAGTGLPNGSYVPRTASFTGVPFNRGKSVSIVASKNNLIGNPYPSAIDGDAFLTANKDVLEGTLYFWTHASTIKLASELQEGTAGSGKFAYTSNDYTTFNYTGGTSGATGIIAAGQGFFAIGGNGGMASFTNRMRLGSGTDQAILDNSQFLKQASDSKTTKTTTTNKVEKNRIWLNFSNTQGAFKQILIGYLDGATDNYDKGYDGISFNGNSFINFYSINNTSLLTIQGRALPIQQTDVVPLGYSSTIVGDFSISIDKTDGALSTMAVFLEDKLTNTTHNLKKGAYTFTTEKGTFNDRFVLSYVDKVTLATDDFQVVENQVVITCKNKEININASTNYIDKVFVYDVTGKQIFLKSKIDKNEFTISNLGSTNHVLVVKVLLQDNSIVTKKIIF